MNKKDDIEKPDELMQGIAIIGMAGRFPGAISIEHFWQNLQKGVESLSFFSDEELIAAGVHPALVKNKNYVKVGGVLDSIDLFDAAFFDLNPKEAEVTDPQHRVFLECAWSAFENAGYDSTKCGSRIGVYAGASLNNYFSFDLTNDQIGSAQLYQKMIGNDKGFLSTRVSYKLNLTGPSITVQTACSTSLVATTLACQSLQNYQCDMALAGGVSIRLPQKTGYLYEPGGPLSPDGHCHAFDAKAQGTTIGNGVGVVVLKRVQDAIADGDCIYAVIKGAAINNDGSMKVGYTAPSVDGQAEAIAEAIMLAEIEPETISYIEAHGSGTALGDPIEIAALTKVFRASTEKKNFCAIGSVKTNIGHLDAAAGVTGLIKTTLALKHQLIPPSLNFEHPNPKIDFTNSPFYVNTELREWKTGSTPRRAGVSSLGMGGTNTHIVLEEAPTLPTSSPSRPWQLLVLSAKTESALKTATQNLSQHLTLHPDINLADVAHTLQIGRRDFNHRRILICSDVQGAIQALNQPASERVVTQFQDSGTRSVTFMFPGEGALYADMGKELYETEPIFRAQVERCCLILRIHLESDLRSVIYPNQSKQETAVEKLQQTSFVQSALFAIEYALAQLWMSWGISPQAMIGQGIGEYVAATLAGVFSLEDALALVASKSSTELLTKVRLNPPTIPLISNVSGTWISQTEAIDPNYWAQIQQPRNLNAGIPELLKDNQRILLEIGCENTWNREELTLLPSIPHPHEQCSDVAFLLNTLGRLWMLGIKIDWSSFYANERRHRLPLPTYPFERQRYWLESTASQESLEHNPSSHPVENQRYSIELDSSILKTASKSLDKKPNIADWFYIPGWKQSMPLVFFQGEEPSKQKLRCLVFVDNYAVGTEFSKRLEQQNQDVITVRVGEQFSKLDNRMYVINPQQADDYDALLQELQKQDFKPNTIAHFWSVTPNDILLNNEPGMFENYQYLGFYSLLFLAQAIGKQDIWDSLKLMVVTSNVHDVTGDENLYPQKATILGPCKVIPKEYRNINCSLVDLVMHSVQTPLSQKIIDKLVAELTLQQTNEIVAYRGSHRWIQTFEAVPLEDRITSKTKLKKGGVYLITGGLGGIGLVLAEHLLKTLQAKLILIGRGGLPGRSEWEQWLVTHDSQDSISRKIQKVRSLEELGAEVEVKNADVTDYEQMQAVIAQALQKFGQINGVIHAAGIAGGGVTQLKTPEMISNVLAAKVTGTLILEKVFKNINLDFFVLCSSKTSILGEFGQIDYCAANAFLDAYAHRHAATSDGLIISISWDVWQEVGLAVDTVLPDKIKQERAESLKKGILPQEGIDAFNRILASNLPHLVVSTQDLPALIKQNNSPQYLQEQLTLLDSKLFSVNLSKAKHPRPNLGNDYVAPENKIEQILAEIWQEILGIDQIGLHDNFFELGGNSINTIQIAAKANQAGLKLTSQQFFHYQTIAELTTDLSITQTIQTEQEQDLGTKELHLTPIQHWFLKHNQINPHHCNQSLLLEILQIYDSNLLEQALQHLIEHHDVFRLRLIQKKSGWQQIYTSSHDTIELKRVDLSALPEIERKLTIESQAAELEASLNLFEGPLVRFAFFDLIPQQTSYLLIVIHHLAVDSVSWRILLQDLQTAYQQISQGKAIHLPANTSLYMQWTQFLQEYAESSEMIPERDYWLQEIQKSFSRLPVDYLTSDNAAANADTVSVCLSKQETKALLEDIHKAYNTQINDVLLTALVQAFAIWTGEQTLWVDIKGNGRNQIFKDVNLSSVVGSFTTCFPVILDITKSAEPGDALIAIKEYLRGIPNSGIGYGILQYFSSEQDIQSKLQAFPQPEVSFNYFGQYDQMISDLSLFGLPKSFQVFNYNTHKNQVYLLEVNAIVVNSKLQLDWTYSQTIHRRETIQKLAYMFIESLQFLIIHCQSVEAEKYTPSDFPRAKLNQQQLDNLLSKINQKR